MKDIRRSHRPTQTTALLKKEPVHTMLTLSPLILAYSAPNTLPATCDDLPWASQTTHLPGKNGTPYRTLLQVQTRGRWALVSSVQRYSKTVLYIYAQNQVSDELRRFGARRARRMGPRPSIARD